MSKSKPNPPPRQTPKDHGQLLDRALEVLEDDPEKHPQVPETLLARNPTTGLPLWLPRFRPETGEKWKNPAEARQWLAERLATTLPVDSPSHSLSPTERQSVVSALHRISSELHSMGFDTPA